MRHRPGMRSGPAPWLAALLVLGAATPARGTTVVRGPYLVDPRPTSVLVRFRTDVPVAGRLFVSDAAGGKARVFHETSASTEHALRAEGLLPGHVYDYAVGTDGGGWIGFDGQHRFRTPPAPGDGAPLEMAFLGDVGTGNADQARVRDALFAFLGPRTPDALALLGDNAYLHGTDAEYQNGLFYPYREVFWRVPLIPVYGNHDALSANAQFQTGPYFDIFDPAVDGGAGGVASGTEAYYSLDLGDVHVIVLNSAQPQWTPMLAWLQADLQARTAPWTLVLFHHPPYSKGSHDSDVEKRLIEMRQKVVPLLEAAGVDLVLSGHSHDVERTFLIDGHIGPSASFGPQNLVDGGDGRIAGDGPYEKPTLGPGPHEGSVFVVAGSSGKLAGGSHDHPAMFFQKSVFGSFLVDVCGPQLDARAIDDTGHTVDSFTIVKGGALAVPFVHRPVGLGAAWRFFDQGTPPPADWNSPAFDDSAWPQGPAPLGYGETFIQTPVSFGTDPAHKPITTWFRAVFDLPFDPATVRSARLFANYDDGFVVYLNGQEIARAGLAPGPVAPGDTAVSHEALGDEVVAVELPPALLAAGKNVLAAEVHQTSKTSSDLVWDAALEIDAFVPHLGDCAGGDYPVLRVAGTDGGPGRGVHLPAWTAAPLEVDASDGVGPEPFLLFVTLGQPAAADAVAVPGAGTFCAPPDALLAQGPATPLPALLTVPPAPWQGSLPPLPPGLEFVLQAVLFAPSGTGLSNAVFLRVD